MIGSEEEKQRIKEYVRKETSHIDKTIRDIEKYWDAKLVKIRSDLNVHQLMKRLDEKASHNDTVVMFEESSIRVKD
jgi:phage-related minor tail protein